MIKFKQIDQIYLATHTISDFRSTFDSLSNLNQILHKHLPENLAALCHVGAIDLKKRTAVIYVSDQQVLHIIKNMSDLLLRAFYTANYPFDQLLVKVSPGNIANKIIKNTPLTPPLKAKLSELAIAIGKPELIIDYSEDEADENEITL